MSSPSQVLPERRLLVCGIEGSLSVDVLADLLCSLAKHHSVFDPVNKEPRSII